MMVGEACIWMVVRLNMCCEKTAAGGWKGGKAEIGRKGRKGEKRKENKK